MSGNNTELGIFDIRTPEAFFASALSKFKKYQDPSNQTKSTEDILYCIMVLTHLREWIAPNFLFSKDSRAETAAQQFGIDLFNECDAFRDLQSLCNATKHLNPTETEAHGGLNFDEWESIDDVLSFDNGPATGHRVLVRRGSITIEYDIDHLIETVILKYKDWFERNKQND